jgi:endo-1,4-beta-xylanase
MCLDNPGGQTANGTNIWLWGCNGGTNQNWIISNRSNGGLEIKNQQSGKCLTNEGANGGGNNTGVAITDCSSNDYAQIWLFTTS